MMAPPLRTISPVIVRLAVDMDARSWRRALLLAQYSHQASLLYEKKRELKEEYKRTIRHNDNMYQAETSAINEKLKELIRQCEELRPKPKCFGTNDCCEIPACDECKFIRECHRAVMVQEGI